ncbi:hypothetical protein NQZ68_013309 [Dissostichus eleginoides]|nr:hypothetical protein NQZ68_013309 [Dissostichus eleginoides]
MSELTKERKAPRTKNSKISNTKSNEKDVMGRLMLCYGQVMSGKPCDNGELLDCGGRAFHHKTNRGCIYYPSRVEVVDLRQAEGPETLEIMCNLIFAQNKREEDGQGGSATKGARRMEGRLGQARPQRILGIFFSSHSKPSRSGSWESDQRSETANPL